MKAIHPNYLCSLLGIFCLFSSLYSQSFCERIQRIEFLYDTEAKLQFQSKIPLIILIHYKSKNGKKLRSKSFETLHELKNHLEFEISNATYAYGKLFYTYDKVMKTGGEIQISLKGKENTGCKHDWNLKLPKLDSVSLSYSKRKLTPEIPIPIDLTLYYEDGTISSLRNPQISSIEELGIHPSWEDFEINLDNRSEISWEPYFRPSGEEIISFRQLLIVPKLSKTPELSLQIRSKYLPELKSTLHIELLYNNTRKINFNAFSRGGNAKTVNIYLKKVEIEGHKLLWVKAVQANKKEEILINPELAQIFINCRGGNGKNGRPGTAGIDGDLDLNICGTAGMDGGNGGKGGNGADVFIYTDQESKSFLQLLQINNQGGRGGLGGRGGRAGRNAPNWVTNGKNGANGSDGLSGNSPQIIILPSESLAAMVQLVP